MNKRRIIVLLLIFTCISLLFSKSLAEHKNVFEKGVKAYEERNYTSALNYFLSLENEGIINSDLYYNIGNTYFRLQEKGKAILYFKKALKVQPNNQNARRNLDFALTIIKDKQVETDSEPISKLWKSLYNSLSLDTFAVILLMNFFFLILIIDIMILRYRKRDKTVPMFVMILLLVFFLLFSVLSYLKWQHYHSNDEGVLISSSAIGYSGPDEEFTRVFTIHEGMIFEIEKQENNWSLIKLGNGLGGWIKTGTYERVVF